MAVLFQFSNQNQKIFASANGGAKFYVASETTYQHSFHGLVNNSPIAELKYEPADYEATLGWWSWFLQPTVECESMGSFHCLNTYDRAAFTFGFLQYAAHVPNGDFIKFFRELLALPDAKEYFPRLQLKNNRVWYVNGATEEDLEVVTNDTASGENQLKALMNYLNPDRLNVDDQEKISAARMVHWAMQDAAHRNIQASIGVALFKNNMKSYAASYNLDGKPDYVCHTIADIRHQGRAKSSLIINILQSSSNIDTVYAKLLEVGKDAYPERINTLKRIHKKLKETGKFGVKKYSVAKGDFVAK